MDNKKQRIAIAEACGYYPMPCGDKWTRNPNGLTGPSSPLPDYLNDLNAMDEARKVLTSQRHRVDYWFAVARLVEEANIKLSEDSGHMPFLYLHATAAQRAEALLKTLNLWTES
jgi:hypothetical protein